MSQPGWFSTIALWRRLASKSALVGRFASFTRIPTGALITGDFIEYSVSFRQLENKDEVDR